MFFFPTLINKTNHTNTNTQQATHTQQQSVACLPVLAEEGHGWHGVEQLQFAHGPAWPVDAIVGQLDGRQTLAGQRLERGEHGAAHKRLAQLRLVHE